MSPSQLSFIGSNVRRHRKARKWTQEELARKADISRIALIHIESDKAVPTLDTLASLANVLELPMTNLLTPPEGSEAEKQVAFSSAVAPETEALDFEVKSIIGKLRNCNLSQVVTLRKVIDTVLIGYHERPTEEV